MKKQSSENKKEIVGQAKTLASFINYQEGSVVSRTIIDKKAGSITLFAFDQGQGLSEHTTPYDAFVYIIEGEASAVISGNCIRLNNGEMTIMPAGEPHALSAPSRFKMLLTMIR